MEKNIRFSDIFYLIVNWKFYDKIKHIPADFFILLFCYGN